MSASFDLHVHINTVNMFCQRALEILQKDHTSVNEIQVKSLEAIAEARSTLGMAARFMYMSCGSDYEKWRRGDTRGAMENLFKTVQALCASVRFRSAGQTVRGTCHFNSVSKPRTRVDRTRRTSTERGKVQYSCISVLCVRYMNIVESPSFIYKGIKCRPVTSFAFLQDTHDSFMTTPY